MCESPVSMRRVNMSWYDKKPDYGGPDPSWREGVALGLVVFGVTVFLVWLTH